MQKEISVGGLLAYIQGLNNVNTEVFDFGRFPSWSQEGFYSPAIISAKRRNLLS
jgi:hypothetical protein